MKKSVLALLCLLYSVSLQSAPVKKVPTVPLQTLHASFVKNGKSPDGVKALQGEVQFSGIVLSHSENLSGIPLLVVGARGQTGEMARLSGYDKDEEAKMTALPVGGAFTAVCTVPISLRASYITFVDCVFK